MMRYKQARRW